MSRDAPTIPGLTVLDRIGQGGFATVWRATDDTFGREVAVKVMAAQLTDERTAMRFERECRALGAVAGHPNIVTVHQAGTTPDGRPYLVMGFERGGSFADRIADAPLAWRHAVEVGADMADALAVAHDAGVLHRDVKPENILVGDFGAPKLSDFGIARLVGGQYTTAGEVTASVAHAPPEVLDGHPPDERSDLYSLCSTVHQLIGGRPPFYDEADASLVPLIGRIVTMPPPRLPPPVPDALNDLLARGLAKAPDARIQTAADLGAQFRSVRSGDDATTVDGDTTRPVSAPAIALQTPLRPSPAGAAPAAAPPPGPPPPPAVDAERVRRRWWPAVLVGVVALVAAGAGAWFVLDRDGDDPTDTSAGGDITTTSPTTVATSGAPPTSTGSTGSLEAVLISADDVGSGASVLDEKAADSGTEGDHPLVSYDYCSIAPDLSDIGPGAARVLTTNALDPGAIVGSVAASAASPAAAEALVDEMVANANTCEQYEDSGLSMRVNRADRTQEGADIELTISGGLGPDSRLLVTMATVDDLVVSLETSPDSDDRDRLLDLLIDRAESFSSP